MRALASFVCVVECEVRTLGGPAVQEEVRLGWGSPGDRRQRKGRQVGRCRMRRGRWILGTKPSGSFGLQQPPGPARSQGARSAGGLPRGPFQNGASTREDGVKRNEVWIFISQVCWAYRWLWMAAYYVLYSRLDGL